ncbi:MAG: MBL fold metallo-hydrolase [Candidatus Caldatribacteriota bacterium]|nr:MBL fold metallo-hydrolase [Candidatus Caldatribacteriota bacterium]
MFKNIFSLYSLVGFILLIIPMESICISENSRVYSYIREKVSIKIVYDNYRVNPDLISSWGFSCVIKTSSQTILFDTGVNSSILLSNMRKMNIDPKKIDIVFISHIHADHLGGLLGFLEKNENVTVYIPTSFPDEIKKQIKLHGAQYQNIGESMQISDNIFTTGQMGTWIKEQSIILKTGDGLIVITGCAHPGIVNIINKVKKILPGEKIFLVMGGFHLSGVSELSLKNIVGKFKEAGIQKVAPSHCSGDRCRELFKANFKENYINSGLGKIILF